MHMGHLLHPWATTAFVFRDAVNEIADAADEAGSFSELRDKIYSQEQVAKQQPEFQRLKPIWLALNLTRISLDQLSGYLDEIESLYAARRLLDAWSKQVGEWAESKSNSWPPDIPCILTVLECEVAA